MPINSETCELHLRGQWVEITIEDALPLDKDRRKRCPECHGKVRAHTSSADGMRAHFEHFQAHAGCLRSTAFNCVNALHPKSMSRTRGVNGERGASAKQSVLP